MTDHARWPYVVAGCGTAAVCAFIANVAWPTPSPIASPPVEPAMHSSFCADGLETIADGACFAAHEGARALVVYLHGRYAPASEREELDRQARVARLATTRGFAVLALRGVQGECATTELADWFCWPSNSRNASDAPAFVARMAPLLDGAKKRVGARAPTYLLGFSNGAYFASILAERALVPFDAIVIAHGGPLDATNNDPPRATPILLVTADDDPSDDEMQALDRELSRRKWPHDMIAREGGHALPDWDISMALAFFDRSRTESLPLEPPLARRESHHVAEAGALGAPAQ